MAETALTITNARDLLAAKSDEVQSLHSRLSNLRARVETGAEKIQTVAVAVGGAFIFGNFRRDARARGMDLASIGGMDPALVYGALAYFLGPMIGGQAGNVLQAAGIGILCAFGYEKGQAPTPTR